MKSRPSPDGSDPLRFAKTHLRFALAPAFLALLLFTACGESTPEPPADPPAAPAPETTPASADAAEETKSLTILYWQAPSLPSPYLSGGIKDTDAAAVTLEPLANFGPDGRLVPKLAAEIPTIENGGFSSDLTSITWKLREGLKWSDGSDMTADDVVFTWRYCVDEETGCTAESAFTGIQSVQSLDSRTVQITFDAPTSYPYTAFVGAALPIISGQQFAGCIGRAAVTCETQNAAPLGTGPYRIVEFTPNDRAVYERNPFYWGPTPYFERVVLKGGGDAVSAARAVLEAGEADYAWNLQVEPDLLAEMEAAGRGTIVSAFASLVERIVVNQTNPDPALGDDRSEYLDGGNPHPFLTFTPIPRAMSMAIDRNVIAEQLYGFAGQPACNLITAPPKLCVDRERRLSLPGPRGRRPAAGRERRPRQRRRRHPRIHRHAAAHHLPNLHQRHPPEHAGADPRLVGADRDRGRADRPRRGRLLRGRPGRQLLSPLLRGRANVRFGRRHRPSAVPGRPDLRAYSDAGEQLGRQQHRPLLQPRSTTASSTS